MQSKEKRVSLHYRVTGGQRRTKANQILPQREKERERDMGLEIPL
ncbi:hypothetical protein LINPERPRIM_LOCUS32325 [Linum perenne]